MRALSFGWTWPPFVAREKTITRRTWKLRHLEGFQRAFRDGETIQAIDKGFHAGGKRIGTLKLTQKPDWELMETMPDGDYTREGFQYFSDHPSELPASAIKKGWANDNCSFESFSNWRYFGRGHQMVVVRFEILTVEPWAVEALNKLRQTAEALERR